MAWNAQHISIAINRLPEDTYAYAADPRNLPEWAEGLSGSIEREGERWVADSPMGRIRIQFAPHNSFGILDHEVTLPSGEIVYNPMRILRNHQDSEVVFTIFQRPGMSDQDRESDAAQVRKDLMKLKRILEGQ